jgi:PAS domain-containing protein
VGGWGEIEAVPGSPGPAQESFVQSALNGLPFLVWLEDAQGRQLMANEAFERWLRDDAPQAADGSPGLAFMERGNAPGLAGAQALTERSYLDRHGERRWMEVSCAALQGQGPQGARIFHARDISSRKTVEQELKRTLAFVQGIIDAFSGLPGQRRGPLPQRLDEEPGAARP